MSKHILIQFHQTCVCLVMDMPQLRVPCKCLLFTDLQRMNRRGDNPLFGYLIFFWYCGVVAFMWVGLLSHINFMFVVLFKKWSVLASVSALPACNVCFNHVFYTAVNVRNRFVQPFQFVLWIKLMCDSAWNVRLVWVAGTICSGCVWFLFCTEWKRIHLQLRGL